MAMPDPALILSQWFSIGSPVETPAACTNLALLIKAGEVKSERDLVFWLETMVTDGHAYHDSVYLISAFEAKYDVVLSALSAVYQEYLKNSHREAEIAAQSSAFARRVRKLHSLDVGEYAYPVAVGAAAYRIGASFDMTIRMYVETFAKQAVSMAAPDLGLNKQAQRNVIDAVRPQIIALSKAGQKVRVGEHSILPTWMVNGTQPLRGDARAI